MSFAARWRRRGSRQPPDPPSGGEPALPDPKGYPWEDEVPWTSAVAEEPAAEILEEPATETAEEAPIESVPPDEPPETVIEPWVPEPARVEPPAGRRPRARKPRSRSRSAEAPLEAAEEAAGEPTVASTLAEFPREISIETIEVPEATEEIPVEPHGEPAAQVEPTRAPSHRARAVLSLIGLGVAAFGIGLVVFNNMVMPRLIHSVGEVRVPDLTNLTIEQAERTLRPMSLVLSRSGERFDPSVPRGFILAQEPTPETPVRGNKRVMVVVSLGEEFSTVPELFGESLRSARYLLERAGLKVGAITRAPSEEVGEGLVAGSDPPAEALLARDTPVSLLVSSGTGGESYVMPDVGGREITGVRRRFESLGFRVFTPPSAPSVGAIVFQDPPPGSRITRGATIMLQASGRMGR